MPLYGPFYGVQVAVTPVWSGGGTPPSLGNGTLTGTVVRLGPALILVSIKLTAGSTTTFGSSYWNFTLPAPFNNVSTAFGGGNSLMFHGSNFPGIVTNGLGSAEIYPFSAAGVLVSSAVPFAWATGDTLEFSFLMTGP